MTSRLNGKKILIGVTSGIAIYKVLSLISKMRKLGASVEVIMTEDAAKFVQPITFETMSDNTVYTDMWVHPGKVLHIDITNDVDLFLVAPATANTIAKVNAGIADNLLTTAILASKAPVAFTIAMNTNMFYNPITQRNISQLRDLGYGFIDSVEGQLACNTFGQGKMADPEDIIEWIEDYFVEKDLAGKKIIVTGGATISRLDPVRFITNDSSGKSAYHIAREARARGANVVYITGRVRTPELSGVKHVSIETNQELADAIQADFNDADALIMAVAPVDFEFAEDHEEKLKKSEGFDKQQIKFKESNDILKTFGHIKQGQKLIGFAAETNNLIVNAQKKLISKNADYIIANDVSLPDAGFNSDTNIISVISKDDVISYDKMSKKDVANIILDLI